MKIALAHFRVGETDGVSLEMDKWKYVLEKNGHTCFYIAGSQGAVEAHIIPELHYQSDLNNKIVDNAYKNFTDYENEEEFKQVIFNFAKKIEDGLVSFIETHKIDVVVPNNIWSLGWHLPAGIAFTNAAKRCKNVKFIAHNHDFYWERILYSNPKVDIVKDVLENYFLPDFENTKHCVINKIAQDEVKNRKGIETVVVPNVFDFNQPAWKTDEFNSDLREKLNIKETDIVMLQATRIAERKAIEFAIDVIAQMNTIKENFVGKTLYNGNEFSSDSEIHFIMIGLNEAQEYHQFLINKLENANISYRYVNSIFEHSREENKSGDKTYSIWDSYVFSDFVTYPSILEGWGNQLLEAMFAKKPVMVYEYPVFKRDLKEVGIEFTSIGDKFQGDEGNLKLPDTAVQNAAQEIFKVLTDSALYSKQSETNYSIGKKHFSYEALEVILNNMFKE